MHGVIWRQQPIDREAVLKQSPQESLAAATRDDELQQARKKWNKVSAPAAAASSRSPLIEVSLPAHVGTFVRSARGFVPMLPVHRAELSRVLCVYSTYYLPNTTHTTGGHDRRPKEAQEGLSRLERGR